jgi:hypothetical protein
MYIYISNVRNVSLQPQPMRVRGKKRYVPKTHLNMFAKAEQTYFNGSPAGMVGVNSLVKSKQNVIEGRLEDKPRVKCYDQFNETFVHVVDKQMNVLDKRFMYLATLNKSLPKEALLTSSEKVWITNLQAVNELFSAIMRVYGYTTESIYNKVKENRAQKQKTNVTIKTTVRLEHKGQPIYMYINKLIIKDAWINQRGIQFNFAKDCVEAYKDLIKQLA